MSAAGKAISGLGHTPHTDLFFGLPLKSTMYLLPRFLSCETEQKIQVSWPLKPNAHRPTKPMKTYELVLQSQSPKMK
jgi:hypothetical protein